MNKIIRLWIIYGFCLFLTSLQIKAQSVLNKYGLEVISNMNYLKKLIKKNPDKELTDISKKIPNLVLDLKYSGRDNFTHQQLYPHITTTYLRRFAAESLAVVQRELNKKGLGLKIFDAYRPYSITEKMWELVKDDRYAADPRKGSGHNRGIAVDLTIIDLNTRKELNMGTNFDNFTDSAHHTFNSLPKEVLQNRLLLKTLMEKEGFKSLETEWWHYSLADIKKYELLDINFKQLRKD